MKDQQLLAACKTVYDGRQHSVYVLWQRRPAKRTQSVHIVAVAIIAGVTPYVGRRPRHLAEDTRTMSMAAMDQDEARAVLAEGHALARDLLDGTIHRTLT